MPDGPQALPDGFAPVLPGGWVALDGTALSSERMRIRLAGQVVPFDQQNVSNARIAVQLPADIQAGLTTIQVEHLFLPEAGPPERLWEMSNAAPVVVALEEMVSMPRVVITEITERPAATRIVVFSALTAVLAAAAAAP